MSAKSIGVITSSNSSAFVVSALSGLETALQGTGFEMDLIEVDVMDPVVSNRKVERMAFDKAVAGILYVHMPLNVRQIAMFRESKLPVAYLAGRMEGIDWCMVDETVGAYEATRHLLGMGHKRIALVSGPLVALESRLREDGFLAALKEDGIQFGRQRDIKILNFSEGEGYEAAHMLFNLPEPPTALFVSAGDLTALGVLSALKERGIQVPEQCSVVGYDDLSFAATLEVPLTTVRQPLVEMGAKCMSRLIDAIKNPAGHVPGGELFKPELVIRKSSGQAPE